jgi:hypothetical protein
MTKYPLDKVAHFLVGYILAVHGSFAAIFLQTLSLTSCLAVGFALSVLVGIAKEVYDYLHPGTHTPDRADARATVVGGLAGTAMTVLIAAVGFSL